MDRVDESEHLEKQSHDQSPSLLTVILDTNPAAWALLSDTLPLSSAVANILVFINAHLASNFTNKVAVIASHCDKAQWLYPTALQQHAPRPRHSKRPSELNDLQSHDQLSEPTKRLKLNAPRQNGASPSPKSTTAPPTGDKYRPFRLVEAELLTNLTTLLASTSPSLLRDSTSTMIAGALTLALSYINRESIAYAESLTGTLTLSDANNNPGSSAADQTTRNSLQSRILLISASPSTDLAHQYIPIMNAIFACQRLSIPIDILQLPLPSTSTSTTAGKEADTGSSTVFLQQAADATHGIFILARLTPPHPAPTQSASPTPPPTTTTLASHALQTYLLTSLLSSPATRTHLILPTRIDVDFRAACFCHRRVIDTGFVCSICLSIFCSPPEDAVCLTCGTQLTLAKAGYGGKPVVVARRKGKKKRPGIGGGFGSAVDTPPAI